MILIWPSLIIVLMVSVRCISRLHRLTIDFQDETLKNFLSENTSSRALIFGMYHHLVDLYQNCSNYFPGAQNGPAPGSQVYIGLYRENMKNLLVWNHKA